MIDNEFAREFGAHGSNRGTGTIWNRCCRTRDDFDMSSRPALAAEVFFLDAEGNVTPAFAHDANDL